MAPLRWRCFHCLEVDSCFSRPWFVSSCFGHLLTQWSETVAFVTNTLTGPSCPFQKISAFSKTISKHFFFNGVDKSTETVLLSSEEPFTSRPKARAVGSCSKKTEKAQSKRGFQVILTNPSSILYPPCDPLFKVLLYKISLRKQMVQSRTNIIRVNFFIRLLFLKKIRKRG
jgi:hypothetical protein